MIFQPRRVGTEIELPIYVKNVDEYTAVVDRLWYDMAAELGDEWTVTTDKYSGASTGVSRKLNGETTALSFDSSIFLFEFALSPKDTIAEVESEWRMLLPPVLRVMKRYGATLLGIGMHPELDSTSDDALPLWRTKRGLYTLLDARGWNHRRILHCASTQPAVDVFPDEILNVMNTLESILPLLQPIFANSPLQVWKQTDDIVDNRDLLAWTSVMQKSVDHAQHTVGMPETAYRDLRSYYDYLHSIPVYYLHHSRTSYKNTDFLIPTNNPATGKPPSLRELHDAGKWSGFYLNRPDHLVEFSLNDFDVNTNTNIDWYSFRPVRLHTRLKHFESWDDYFSVMAEHPEHMIESAYIEIRSIDTQLPGQEFLPMAIVLAAVRMHKEIAEWMKIQLSWSAVHLFYATSAHRLCAWSEQVNGHDYAVILKELVSLLIQGLNQNERAHIEPLTQRIDSMSGPAVQVTDALAQGGREQFFRLTVYR